MKVIGKMVISLEETRKLKRESNLEHLRHIHLKRYLEEELSINFQSSANVQEAFFFFLNREVILEGKSTKLLNSFSIQYQEHLITKVGLVSRGYPLGLTKSLHTDCSRQDVDSVWVQGSGVCRELHSQTSAVTCLRSSSCPDETNGIIYYPSKCFKIKTCVLAFSSWTRIQIFVGTINRESMGIDIMYTDLRRKGYIEL